MPRPKCGPDVAALRELSIISANAISRTARGKTAPLRAAEDAYVIDTSFMSLKEVVEKIVFHLRSRGLKPVAPAGSPTPRTWEYWLCWSLAKFLTRQLYEIDVHHAEKADFPGGCFVAANHTSFLDPPMYCGSDGGTDLLPGAQNAFR